MAWRAYGVEGQAKGGAMMVEMECSKLLSLLSRAHSAIFWGTTDETQKRLLTPLLLELQILIAELEKAEL